MHREKRKKMWMLPSTLMALLLAVGLTYAWMAQRASMTTLLTITPPDKITIIPTTKNGSELTALDLDYNENNGDKKDPDGMIHIYRPVCIKSTERFHRLEIVHTTNLNDLDFKIYPAEKKTDEKKVVTIQSTNTTPLSGEYKNKQPGDSKLAERQTLDNYQTTDHVADVHAYPLYWIVAGNCQADTSNMETGADQKTYYSTYYILEISWKETTKETDLFYIMAQNVAE